MLERRNDFNIRQALSLGRWQKEVRGSCKKFTRGQKKAKVVRFLRVGSPTELRHIATEFSCSGGRKQKPCVFRFFHFGKPKAKKVKDLAAFSTKEVNNAVATANEEHSSALE